VLVPGEIAKAAHRLCVTKLIPAGVSYDHEVGEHMASDEIYGKAVNDAGLDVTGQQVIDAVLDLVPWDQKSPWPGHPSPELVVRHLQGRHG
jgi:hypothetical protein